MSESKHVRVVIEGRVQGVWFRGWLVEQAGERALNGWVRNRSDGTVEVVLSGPSASVEAMVAACYTGPPAARVARLLVEPTNPPPGSGFHTRPTV